MTATKPSVFLFLTAFAMLAACSSDDDAPEPDPDQFVRFEATGAVSGSYSGSGAVERLDDNGDHTLVFNFTDGAVFRLEFIQGPADAPPPFPSAGEYSLGGLGGESDFAVVVTNLGQGTTFLGFTEGTIIINEVGATYTTGTFEFTTSAITNPDNSVEVTDGVWRVFTPE